MLKVTIPEREWYDSKREEFIYSPKTDLVMEHSLLSISKWESTWKKSFFRPTPKPIEEMYDYYKCMTVNQDVDPIVYASMPDSIRKQIDDYIEDDHTATHFMNERKEGQSRGFRRSITSEVVYGWMVEYGIPFQCERWHLGRLMALIRICQQKNTDPKGRKKMSQAELMRRNTELNRARLAKSGRRG